MTILVTGGKGQLGTALSKVLPYAIFTGSKDLDITDPYATRQFIKNNDITTIINCAAYTAVDAAEDDYYTAKKVNAIGPKVLANLGKRIIHISTDYVFDGKNDRPYKEFDNVNPLSVYGYTKMLGEKEILKSKNEAIVIRTSWLFSNYGKNFFKTMQKLGSERTSINVVADQFGTPTYAPDLADAIVQIIPQMDILNNGIYNFSNMGACSWYAFAYEIMKQSGLQCLVNPIPISEYPTKAIRPQYSVLDKTKIKNTFGIQIPDWQNALSRCIASNEKVK